MELLPTTPQNLQESTLYLAGAGFCVFILVILYNGLKHPLANVPGPWHTRWTDWVYTYHNLRGAAPLYIHALHQKYGPVVRVSTNFVNVADLKGAQRIHRIRGEFLKSPWYQNIAGPDRLNVFNTQDIDEHRRLRRLLSGPMSESNLKTLIPQVENKVRLAIDRMVEETKSRGVADVAKWWMFMATDVIGELTFGESFRMLEYGKKNQYIHDLEEVGKLSALNVTFPLLTRLASYIHIPIFDKSQQNLQHFDHHVMQSLQRHRTLVENDDRNVKSTLFSKMYKAEDENGLTPTEMAHNALAYIVAGSDTTANTLAYLVWAVCKNPEVKKRLAEEVKTLPDTFSDDDIRELPYLDQVIKETLRLYPSVPSPLPRVVPAGGEMLGDQWLPGGTTVSSQAFTLHRNPEIFSYPEMFNPSRWEEPTQAMKDSILTFGGGSRICIGIHLAQLELRLATARFFRTFPNATVSSLEGMSDADMEQNMFFLMSPKGQRCLIQAF